MPVTAKTKTSKAGFSCLPEAFDSSCLQLISTACPEWWVFQQLCIFDTLGYTPKKVCKKPEVKTVQHLAESLDRKLQVALDLYHVTTTAFSRFKIQFLLKDNWVEKYPNNIAGKYFYLKPEGSPILGIGRKIRHCALYKTVGKTGSSASLQAFHRKTVTQ